VPPFPQEGCRLSCGGSPPEPDLLVNDVQALPDLPRIRIGHPPSDKICTFHDAICITRASPKMFHAALKTACCCTLLARNLVPIRMFCAGSKMTLLYSAAPTPT